MSNQNSEDAARRATELGLMIMLNKALEEIEVLFGCIADMKASFALSPSRIQQVYDYIEPPKDPFEFINTVPDPSQVLKTLRRNLKFILEEFPTFDAYDIWFKVDSVGDWDDLVSTVRCERKRIARVFNEQFDEFKRRYGDE